MKSKERVKRAIHFKGPDRIPYHLPLPYYSDIVWIFPKGKDLKREIRDGETYRLSEYGSWWHVGDDENMGEVTEPAIKEWSEFEHYKFPDINEKDRYEHVKEVIDKNRDKYIMGVLSISLFPHYWEIRGLTNFFEDLFLDTENMEKLLDIILEKQFESLDIWSNYDIDGIVVGFDYWGFQNNLKKKKRISSYSAILRWNNANIKGHDKNRTGCN